MRDNQIQRGVRRLCWISRTIRTHDCQKGLYIDTPEFIIATSCLLIIHSQPYLVKWTGLLSSALQLKLTGIIFWITRFGTRSFFGRRELHDRCWFHRGSRDISSSSSNGGARDLGVTSEDWDWRDTRRAVWWNSSWNPSRSSVSSLAATKGSPRDVARDDLRGFGVSSGLKEPFSRLSILCSPPRCTPVPSIPRFLVT